MNREDITRMAVQSGFPERHAFSDLSDLYPRLERFFQAAYAAGAAAERETCAEVAEQARFGGRFSEVAAAIRARGNT